MNQRRKEIINALDHVVMLGFAGLFFLSPFVDRMFFGVEQGRAPAFILGLSLISLGGKVWRGEKDFLQKPLDYLVLAFFVLYGAAVFWAADTTLAREEAGKAFSYFLVYWLTYQLAQKGKGVSLVLNAIYFSGVAVALTGMAGAAGLVPLEGGFVNERISSTFGYPNALAAFLGTLVILGIYLFEDGGPAAGFVGWRWLCYFYVAGNYVLMTVFFASGSRGAFLLLPAVAFLFFLGLPGGRGLAGAGHFVVVLLAALAANYRIMAYFRASDLSSLALWLGFGLVCALLGQAVLQAASRWGKKGKYVYPVFFFIFALVVGYGGLQVKNYPVPVKVIPEHIVARMQKIDLDQSSVQARFTLWKDALRIVRDHPVLGLGGGAFEVIYPAYKENPSIRGQVHNHYLKVWTETGSVGLAIFGGIWLLYFYLVCRIYGQKQEGEKRALVWALFCASVMLGSHGAIDYDLSFQALSMVLFCFFGMVRGMAPLTVRI
ncbi:hypothetical protein DCMF_06480 [Candidatus Formimonas warabiya]|uniref:O-antigen ligase-related domain-containing protein n=2 Tax=Formimonas warabiya TaxID=1761012 RepID=A0A3G1KPT9_FORW1|nr:hypothetical protein DCMF_06480 [Candidatus Formimonas warabiya]